MSIQKLVDAYLRERPTILDALEEGLLNYSALARKIVKEQLREKDFDAVVIAIRRSKERARKSRKRTRDINRVLRESTIETRNKRAVVILDSDAPLRLLTKIVEKVEEEGEQASIVNTAHAVTVIIHERFLPLLGKLRTYLKKQSTGLTAITIRSPEELEEVPGVIAHLTRLLATRGINIKEITSCYTDTVIIVERADLEAALEAINF